LQRDAKPIRRWGGHVLTGCMLVLDLSEGEDAGMTFLLKESKEVQ
jgi:hypothetical protein